MFQSPSLRGSGRFPLSVLVLALLFFLFQSPSLRGSGRFFLIDIVGIIYAYVSIPFIAGQWSLHWEGIKGCLVAAIVSIPFIAGQWSLRVLPALRKYGVFGFQSPSLRGSGRFRTPRRTHRTRRSFNPLHCGAVVASNGADGAPQPGAEFQSPSLRGSGRFPHGGGARRGSFPWFQSPSLRGSGRFSPRPAPKRIGTWSFNPLHCGAVVASF